MLGNKFFNRLGLCFISCITISSILLLVAGLTGAQEISDLIAGAKKEGKVIYYTAMSTPHSQLMADEFQKKYPFLKVELLRMSGEKLLVRALTEARSKSLKADVFQASIIQVSQMQEKGLLTKYFSPERNVYPEHFKSPQGYWNATYILPYVITYNTRMVSPGEVPKTYEDLLDPKWKGKIGLDAEEIQWFFHMQKLMGRDKAITYMKQLAKQDLALRKGHTLLVTLCAAGEIPIVVVGYMGRVEEYKEKGAPIDWVRFKSFPILTSINAMGVVKSAPHPNAAKLFYNFVISREGAKVLRTVKRTPSHPQEQNPEVRGLKLHILLPDELLADYNHVVKEWEEIFIHPAK